MDSVDSGQLPGGHAPAHWYDTWDRQSSQSFSSTAKGLRNAPGENNCFLNSAVQVFWHIDVFRRSYRRLSGHLCMGHSCIFCALKVIFTQFQYSDQASLQPSALRKALANTFAKQERFQLGHMDDAAECFENILNRIHYHIASSHNEDTCNAPHCIPHQKFAMTVFDQCKLHIEALAQEESNCICNKKGVRLLLRQGLDMLVCPCGSTSEPLKFHEMVHYISANALVSQSRIMQENGDMLHPNRFGLLLRSAGAVGDIRDCPSNCGKRVQIRRTLLNIPDVVSIGLVWGSDKPDLELTTEVARSIGTTLLLPDIFHSVMCNDANVLPRLHLSSVVCYYGKHYSTFVWHTKLQEWVYFDDATVKGIGRNWENVVEKIIRSRYQPLLLIYSNPNAQPVPTETAPSTRVMAPGYSMTPGKGPQEETKPKPGVGDKEHASSKSRRSLKKHFEGSELNKSKESAMDPQFAEETAAEKEQLSRKSSFEHRRQSSFLIAVTKQKAKDEAIYAVPHNNSAVMNAQKDISQGDMRNNFGRPATNSHSGDVPDGPVEGSDGYNYTLSTSDQYRRPSLNNPDPNKLPLTQNFSRTTETQRKDSFKRGKGSVPADIIRYHVDPARRPSQSSDSDQGSPVHGDSKGSFVSADGKPALPSKPIHVRTRSQSLEDSGNLSDSNTNNNPHKVIKPKPNNPNMFDNADSITRAHTPVQSGLATLPRKKQTSNTNSSASVPSSSTLSSSSSTSMSSSHAKGRPGSQHLMAANQQYPFDTPPPPYSQTMYQNHTAALTYQNVVDNDLHSRQNSNSSILSSNTVVECSPSEETNDSGIHNRQSSSVSQDTLTDKPVKETKSKSKKKEKEEKGDSKKKDKEESAKRKEESKQRKEEKKSKSKKDRNSTGSSKPPTVPDKKSVQKDEGFSEDKFYIDRRMVESVLSFQKLQRSGSCVSQTSTSSVESDSSHKRTRGVTPKDNLSSEIPFDSASLDSHKDSGYGSSDRNSSSSTGSVTLNPYEQYFMQRSMIPPRNFNPQVMADTMKKLMDKGSGMSGLEYTQDGDLKSLVTNPDSYNQNQTVGFCQQQGPPCYPQKDVKLGPISGQAPPNYQQYKNEQYSGKATVEAPGHQDIMSMSKEDRDKHLFDALSGRKKGTQPPQIPMKPQPGLSGQQPRVPQKGALPPQIPAKPQQGPPMGNRGPASGEGLKTGPKDKPHDKGIAPYQEGYGSTPYSNTGSNGDQQTGYQQGPSPPSPPSGGPFLGLCQRAEDVMDSCVLSETSEQYPEALSYCQQAIDLLKQAMRLPNIDQNSYTYAQRKSNSCLLKARSLQKRLMLRQESNTSTTSSDSGTNQDHRRSHLHQSKSQQHLQPSSARPPSRSSSQNSMDSLRDGNTSSGSTRSTTPVFDKVMRPSTDGRVPPIDGHIPISEYQNGYKDRSFETNMPDSGGNNADLYGTLPRRKTQKSQEHTRMCNNQKHEADVYQDFLDGQRRQNAGQHGQNVQHSRTNSGSRTPVNEPRTGSGSEQFDYSAMRSQLSSQNVNPSQAHIRHIQSSSTTNKQYSEQQGSSTFNSRGPGIVPIPVAPPKIEQQSQHTEVGIGSGSNMAPDLPAKPAWLQAANQTKNMHGNYRNQDGCHGSKANVNQSREATIPSFSNGSQALCESISSHVRNGNIVFDVLQPSASASIQMAFSAPLQATHSGHCKPVTASELAPTARFKCGGPNRYRSSETRQQISRSASFSHPTRPQTYTHHTSPAVEQLAYKPSLAGVANGSSQPDLRKLSEESVSMPQRPLTPQVLCTEQPSDSSPVSVRDLMSRFESSKLSDQRLEPTTDPSADGGGRVGDRPQLGHVHSVPLIKPGENPSTDPSAVGGGRVGDRPQLGHVHSVGGGRVGDRPQLGHVHSDGGGRVGDRPQLGHVHSVPLIKPGENPSHNLQRQRSKSESEFEAAQPPRPKSALSKRTRNNTNRGIKPRKSVTFSENICLVAAVDNWHELLNSDHVTQAGYQSDEEDRTDAKPRFTTRTSDDDDSSGSTDSPVEVVGDAACMLCHKQGVQVGYSYCQKCSFYMSRFYPSQ